MSTPKPRWSIWKKLLMFPLYLVVGLEALFVWVIIDETHAPPRIINGQADDAPRFAAFILAFVVAVLYLVYAALIALIRFLVTPPTPQSRS